jgi:two-component system cell cycle response regulator DivK
MMMKPLDPANAYVLVIEDNMQNVVLMSRLLSTAGVQNFQWKASGWQIEEVLANMPRLDLILLDLHLPQEDGFSTLAKLRSNPRYESTCIVAVTADASLETMQQVKEAGFNGFIGKPISVKKFPDQITHLLRGEAVWDLGQS